MMQDGEEFAWLLSKLQHVTSLLEIGSYDGASLRGFITGCPKLKRVRSLDIAPQARLFEYIGGLKAAGFDADVRAQSSAATEAVEWARENGPYDFIYIDGDHDAGVFSDWMLYRHMAPLVGFHDIAHPVHQVKDLWAKIKAEGHWTDEIQVSYQGTGITRP